ncbi:MAG: hypothetical protein JNL08_20635 [Planctomycetes bacterium]|nr:hypothetical protein [Planctomycetota bacterium]
MTAIVLPSSRAVRPRLTWLLPAWFVVASVLGSIWPGRGGQLFCIGALAGVWACFLVDSSGDAASWLWPALLGGVPILLLLGRLLDRLRADPKVWVVLSVTAALGAGYFLLQGYAELDHALERHGSLWSFVVCALQLGSYGATIALLAFSARRTVHD